MCLCVVCVYIHSPHTILPPRFTCLSFLSSFTNAVFFSGEKLSEETTQKPGERERERERERDSARERVYIYAYTNTHRDSHTDADADTDRHRHRLRHSQGHRHRHSHSHSHRHRHNTWGRNQTKPREFFLFCFLFSVFPLCIFVVIGCLFFFRVRLRAVYYIYSRRWLPLLFAYASQSCDILTLM